MCFEILGVIASLAGSFISASAQAAQAQAQADFQNYQIQVQNRQLQEEKDMAYIDARNTEIARIQKARALAANNAAVTAGYLMGGESRSADALQSYNDAALKKDISLLRLNNVYVNQRIADQIAVNNVAGEYARWNAGVTGQAAFAGAIFGGLKTISGAFSSNSAFGL
jgi:hypothetical protein